MRGKARTKEEKYELFAVLEKYLEMGFSLKKACNLADIPYSSMRDVIGIHETLRAKTSALQNSINVAARANIINAIEQGDISASKWWLERFDHLEPQVSPQYGGLKEAQLTIAEMKDEWAQESVEVAAVRVRDFAQEYMR